MTRKIDMEKICPELADVYETYKLYDFKSALMVNPKNINAIAAMMLELAEENERLKEQNEILERNSQHLARKLLAARKGDADDR